MEASKEGRRGTETTSAELRSCHICMLLEITKRASTWSTLDGLAFYSGCHTAGLPIPEKTDVRQEEEQLRFGALTLVEVELSEALK